MTLHACDAAIALQLQSDGSYLGHTSTAYGNMVGNALGQDANARRQYAMGLLQTPLQTATVTGANLVPGSTSTGGNLAEQQGEFDLYRTQGFVPRGYGGTAVRQGETWTNTPYGQPRRF